MLHYYIFFILIITSKCRLYEHISIIQEKILTKMQKSDLSLMDEIQIENILLILILKI